MKLFSYAIVDKEGKVIAHGIEHAEDVHTLAKEIQEEHPDTTIHAVELPEVK